jgi:hypothetical protein
MIKTLRIDLRELHDVARGYSDIVLHTNRFEQLVGETIEVVFGLRLSVDITSIFSDRNGEHGDRLWCAEVNEYRKYITTVHQELYRTIVGLSVVLGTDRLLRYNIVEYKAIVEIAANATEWLNDRKPLWSPEDA